MNNRGIYNKSKGGIESNNLTISTKLILILSSHFDGRVFQQQSIQPR